MIEEGYARYACDRSEKSHKDGKKPVEYLSEHDKRRDDWLPVEWKDIHGVTRKALLCPECAEKWRSIEKQEAQYHTKFIDEE